MATLMRDLERNVSSVKKKKRKTTAFSTFVSILSDIADCAGASFGVARLLLLLVSSFFLSLNSWPSLYRKRRRRSACCCYGPTSNNRNHQPYHGDRDQSLLFGCVQDRRRGVAFGCALVVASPATHLRLLLLLLLLLLAWLLGISSCW